MPRIVAASGVWAGGGARSQGLKSQCSGKTWHYIFL